jgi:hypothetical protein
MKTGRGLGYFGDDTDKVKEKFQSGEHQARFRVQAEDKVTDANGMA